MLLDEQVWQDIKKSAEVNKQIAPLEKKNSMLFAPKAPVR